MPTPHARAQANWDLTGASAPMPSTTTRASCRRRPRRSTRSRRAESFLIVRRSVSDQHILHDITHRASERPAAEPSHPRVGLRSSRWRSPAGDSSASHRAPGTKRAAFPFLRRLSIVLIRCLLAVVVHGADLASVIPQWCVPSTAESDRDVLDASCCCARTGDGLCDASAQLGHIGSKPSPLSQSQPVRLASALE